MSATQQFDVLMDQLARQQQQKVIDQLRAEMKELQSEYAKQTELSKKPKPMLFGKLKWEQEQAEIRGNLNNLKRRFDTNKTRISNLKKQKPYGSHENYNAIAEKHPALFQEMLKEKEQQEQIRQRQRDLEPTELEPSPKTGNDRPDCHRSNSAKAVIRGEVSDLLSCRSHSVRFIYYF